MTEPHLPEQDQQLLVPEAEKKPGILAKSKDFLQTARESISGKDLPRLVEEFTQEMVVVAEGLYADQEALRKSLTLQGEEQDQLAAKQRDMEKQLSDISRKVDALKARADKRARQDSGLMRILKQITWISAILGGAWVITTLIRAFVK